MTIRVWGSVASPAGYALYHCHCRVSVQHINVSNITSHHISLLMVVVSSSLLVSVVSGVLMSAATMVSSRYCRVKYHCVNAI